MCRLRNLFIISFFLLYPHVIVEILKHDNSVIVIRGDRATPSSCDSIFTDAVSSIAGKQILSITKLEQFNIIGNESIINVAGEFNNNNDRNHHNNNNYYLSEEMPIVKNGSANGQPDGSDKGMFNVSRVKKVELSEIPLASDICSTCK
jgi:hypothetical protein